MKRFIYLICNY